MDNIFNRIININISALVFLVPLFFLPFSFEAFEYNKQYLLFFLTSLSLFCWLAKMALIDKELRFKRTPLDIFILGFLAVGVLSAVFSVDKSSSLYGFYGRFSNGLIGLLSLGALYFVITNNLEAKRIAGLLKTFLWSSFVAVLLTYLAIFGLLAKLGFLPGVMRQIIFNPTAASLEGFAVFLAAVVALLAGLMLAGIGQDKTKTAAYWFLLIVSLGLLATIDFTAAWVILLITLVLLVAFSLWKRFFKENVNRFLIPIFLIVVATVFIPFDSQKTIINLPREQVLGQAVSWQVGLASAIASPKNMLLGSGIGTFNYDFAKEKPLSINESWLWQIRFDRSGSHLSEVLATMGFPAAILYLIAIGLFLMMNYFMLQKIDGALPLLALFLALLAGQFLYYQNTALAFLFWTILALSVVSWQKPVKEKVVSFKEFPELSLVFSTLVIVIGVAFLAVYFYGVKFYLADANYAKAQRTAVSAEKMVALEKATRLNPNMAQYRSTLAKVYMNEALNEMAKPQAEQDVAKTQTLVAAAINQARTATELEPNQVANWENLGAIYSEINNAASGATEWGIKSFQEAIRLEPKNPVLYTDLGKLFLANNEIDKAKEQFATALSYKKDYLDALTQQALVFERQGDGAAALKELEKLAANYPNARLNVEILFQLGRLYFNNNRVAEAIVQFKQVTVLAPNHSNAHYSLGIAYVAQGKKDLALKEFEKVLELNPGNADVQKKIDQLR